MIAKWTPDDPDMAQKGPWETSKSPPKKPLESQAASRRNHENAIEASWSHLEHTLSPRGRFEAILEPHFGVICWVQFGSKIGSKNALFFYIFWAPFWGPKCGERLCFCLLAPVGPAIQTSNTTLLAIRVLNYSS